MATKGLKKSGGSPTNSIDEADLQESLTQMGYHFADLKIAVEQ